MNGNSSSKQSIRKILKHQNGQILLITIMLVATLLTVVLAVTFKSTTETQLTKLEEESQKALAAAEAGVEAALQKNSSVDIASLPNMADTEFTGDATIGILTGKTFVSPLLQKDQQYTFYLSDYPGFTNPLAGDISLFFMTETQCPALELTLLSSSGAVSRRLADPCNQLNKPTEDLVSDSGDFPVDGYNFKYHSDPITLNSGYSVLIARSLFASTRIAMQKEDAGNLPTQGKYVTSEAKSPAGVSKKVQLFQSYPQIPAEFFVTSF